MSSLRVTRIGMFLLLWQWSLLKEYEFQHISYMTKTSYTSDSYACKLLQYGGFVIWFAIVIRAGLSEPHTSRTALQDAWVSLSVCLHVTIYFNWMNWYKGTHTFQIYTHAIALQNSRSVQVDTMDPSYLTPCQWIYWMWRRTPHCVTQRRWIY